MEAHSIRPIEKRIVGWNSSNDWRLYTVQCKALNNTGQVRAWPGEVDGGAGKPTSADD